MTIDLIKYRKGFTLIELLVVLGILSILLALMGGSFKNARSEARSAQKKADLETIRSGLELYKSDKGFYPGNNWRTELSPNYISEIPEPPAATSGSQFYSYRPMSASGGVCNNTNANTADDCMRYQVGTWLEEIPYASTNCNPVAGCGAVQCTFCKTNP